MSREAEISNTRNVTVKHNYLNMLTSIKNNKKKETSVKTSIIK